MPRLTTNQIIREYDRIAKLSAPLPKFELIDWSERFPREDARTITIRQSTYCRCGASGCRKQKQIGSLTCALVPA